MAGVAANDPYQRVATDNGVFDGALIGMAVGAGGAGAGVFGMRMHYNGIDKRSERQLKTIENQQQYHENGIAKSQMAMDQKTGNVGPRFYQKNKYNNSLDAVNEMNAGGERAVAGLESERQRQLNESRQNTVPQVNREAKREARRQTNKRYNYGYPKESAELKPEDVRHSESVNNVRQKHRTRAQEINAGIDDMIADTRSDTRSMIADSKEGQYVKKVGGQMDKRRQNIESKYTKKINNHTSQLEDVAHQRNLADANNMRSRHAYSKMGGMKNAAIIGASAVIGGGIGMIADGLNQ